MFPSPPSAPLPLPDSVGSVLNAILAASDAGAFLTRALRSREPDPSPASVYAVGKGALAMVKAWRQHQGGGEASHRPALAVTVKGMRDAVQPSETAIIFGEHPHPGRGSLRAGREVWKRLREDGMAAGSRGGPEKVVLLLSGGASSLLSLPPHPVPLLQVSRLTGALLRAGAPIVELNAVRKHLDLLKGGGWLRRAFPLPVEAWVLSDVVGDDLAVIGSGPASPDPSTFAEALEILTRYRLGEVAPAATRWLERGRRGRSLETVKPGSEEAVRARVRLCGSNEEARKEVVSALERRGFGAREGRIPLQGEARNAGEALAREALQISAEQAGRPWAKVWGGETTVTVRGRGHGGRCQELALGAAMALRDRRRIRLLAVGTDGIDGVAPPGMPTPAGAWVDGWTWARLERQGGSPLAWLEDNNSFMAFHRLAAAGFPYSRHTGPTGTHVGDLVVAWEE